MLRPILLGIFLTSMADTAWGHVPPAEKIIGLWQGAYEKTSPVTLKGSWQQGAISVPFVVSVQKNAVTIAENGKPSTDATSKLVWDFLFKPAAALQVLRSRGLALEETGLARSGDGIAWTLGATGENRRGTQIWIDREWLTPHQVLLKTPHGVPDTIEFSDFAAGNHLYPQKIRSKIGGVERVFRIDEISR